MEIGAAYLKVRGGEFALFNEMIYSSGGGKWREVCFITSGGDGRPWRFILKSKEAAFSWWHMLA